MPPRARTLGRQCPRSQRHEERATSCPTSSPPADGCSTTHRAVVESFGYRAIETPIIEATELFSRGVGTDTDIVEKQMFTFEDRGGRSLTLRPEGTAGALRAVLGAHLDQEVRPVRVHYAGPVLPCRTAPGGTAASVHPGRHRVHR